MRQNLHREEALPVPSVPSAYCCVLVPIFSAVILFVCSENPRRVKHLSQTPRAGRKSQRGTEVSDSYKLSGVRFRVTGQCGGKDVPVLSWPSFLSARRVPPCPRARTPYAWTWPHSPRCLPTFSQVSPAESQPTTPILSVACAVRSPTSLAPARGRRLAFRSFT